MPTYMVLSRLTEKGLKTLKENPSRIKKVNEELSSVGEIVAQYALFGRFDFVTILKVPDVQTMAKISTEIGARGSVRLQTYPAFEVDEIMED
ncbi:GYD domain superfamily [candidate division MSBL1 archaeon SCGC-AAA259I07]|uniref:GYD domain superfamily n=1 Tax=candidate division MSBL1 archaeon SCGC-AAA259I07 TaxID=1698266 RepID=A0A133UK58_9EURY|nr:GYD domain superfamily [candidate division MSBL1 archaeon SCGC-AAA259I07]